MPMYYANFRGATRRHGRSIKGELRIWLKEIWAKAKRKKKQKVARLARRRQRPLYSKRWKKWPKTHGGSGRSNKGGARGHSKGKGSR